MPKFTKAQLHWDLVTATLNGALLGLVVAVTYNYVDAFYDEIPKEELVAHVFGVTAFFVATGAILLACMAAVHNWLRCPR